MEPSFEFQRRSMVEHLRYMGITDEPVLEAMAEVERHLFIPGEYRRMADPYGDHPCPIGQGQTVSQPYIIAYMIQLMNLTPGDRVLEIGSGSGYVTALLLAMGMDVYAIEIIPELFHHAGRLLPARSNIRLGNGYRGWPEEAPFNGITGGCAPARIPATLLDQLAENGTMVMPEGVCTQCLVLFRRRGGRITRRNDLPVRFVPMTGAAE